MDFKLERSSISKKIIQTLILIEELEKEELEEETLIETKNFTCSISKKQEIYLVKRQLTVLREYFTILEVREGLENAKEVHQFQSSGSRENEQSRL